MVQPKGISAEHSTQALQQELQRALVQASGSKPAVSAAGVVQGPHGSSVRSWRPPR